MKGGDVCNLTVQSLALPLKPLSLQTQPFDSSNPNSKLKALRAGKPRTTKPSNSMFVAPQERQRCAVLQELAGLVNRGLTTLLIVLLRKKVILSSDSMMPRCVHEGAFRPKRQDGRLRETAVRSF